MSGRARIRRLGRAAQSRSHEDVPGRLAAPHPLAVSVVPWCAADGSDGRGLRGG